MVHSKIVFAIFITFFQFPGPFSPGHILHIISNKIWLLWNPDFFLLVLSLHQKSGSLNISQIWEFKDIGVRKRFLFRTGGRAGLIGTFTIQYPCLETPPRIILIPSSHLENTNSYDWSRNIHIISQGHCHQIKHVTSLLNPHIFLHFRIQILSNSKGC